MALILVKHAHSQVNPATPPRTWSLSAEGRRRCAPLAEKLKPYAPAALVSSDEPKARQTAELVGAALGLAPSIVPNLHEHVRDGEPFASSQDAFEEQVRQLMAEPDRCVYGAESAEAARARFAAALGALPATRPLAVVAHGTVIALFAAAHNGLDPFALWQGLGLPSFVVLDEPGFELRAVEGAIA